MNENYEKTLVNLKIFSFIGELLHTKTAFNVEYEHFNINSLRPNLTPIIRINNWD
jgi:hypothetical protein